MLRDRIQRLVHEVGPLDITPCQRHFVVTLMVRTTKFKVFIEIEDLSGVRATSLLCLLGLGLGLGSLLIYRICSRIFQIPPSPRTRRVSSPCQRRRARRPSLCDAAALDHGNDPPDTSPITPASTDSGISSMGQNLSDAATPDSPSVHYSSGKEGVRFRGFQSQISGEDYIPYASLQGNGDPKVNGVGAHSTPTRGRRSPTTVRRQLRIDIPTGDSTEALLSSVGSEYDMDVQTFPDDTQSVGGFSMMPNYSPSSLFEKNLRLSDSGNDDNNEVFQSEPTTNSLSTELNPKMTGSQSSLGYHSNRQSTSSLHDINESIDGDQTLEGDATLYWSTHASLSAEDGHDAPKASSSMTDSGIRSKSHSLSPRHSTPNDPSTDARVPPAIQRIKSEESRSSGDRSLNCNSPISDCSDLSSASKDLTFKTFSLDSDGMSGLVTPDSDLFHHQDIGIETVEGMDEISEEIKALQDDIEEMKFRVRILSSRENLNDTSEDDVPFSPSASGEEFSKAVSLLKRHKSPKLGNSSVSSLSINEGDNSQCGSGGSERNESQRSSNRYSYHHSGEFMWDYGSDLATGEPLKEAELFVVRRPMAGRTESESDSSAGPSGVGSPTFDHVRAYLRSLDSNASLDLSNSSRQGSLSISDVYIDDELSRYGDILSSRTSSRSKESSPDGAGFRSPRYSETPESEKSPVKGAACSSSYGNPKKSNSPDTCGANDNVVESIGPKVPIPVYTNREWRGSTPKAQLMRQGYMKIPGMLKLNNLCRVRGDNYCAIRATVFQALVNRIPVHHHLKGLEKTLKSLSMLQEKKYSYLKNWNFAGRIPVDPDLPTVAANCVTTLFKQFELSEGCADFNERLSTMLETLNSNTDADVHMMEAVKMLIMLEAIHLHQAAAAGQDVPTFAWLMFARDTSLDPESLFKKHINPIGDAHGLEQVEMYLLSHTLGVSVKVVRPSASNDEDFITTFSEDDTLPQVTLIAEDDRHYNILLP